MKTFGVIRLVMLMIVAVALLSGCSQLPSPSQTENADYGSYPSDYESIVTDFLMQELRDPDSVQIGTMSEPKKQWIGDSIRGTDYGYLVCVEVNSKNIFGNMTGLRSDALLIRDDIVVKYIQDSELFGGMVLCD